MQLGATKKAQVGRSQIDNPHTKAYEAHHSLCQQICLRPFLVPIISVAHLRSHPSTASDCLQAISLMFASSEKLQMGFDRDQCQFDGLGIGSKVDAWDSGAPVRLDVAHIARCAPLLVGWRNSHL